MWHIGGVPVVERNHPMLVTLILFTAVACLATWLRVFTRIFLVRNLGIDDGFVVLAMLGTIGFLIATVEQIKYGLGDSVNPALIQNFLQSLLATIVAYSVTHTCVKFSIVLQCHRIFTEPPATRVFLGLLIWMTIYGLFCVLSSLIECLPLAKYWNMSLRGTCLNRSNLHYSLAALNIFNDIMILTAPIPFLKKLHIPRRTRIILYGVFACGGFACIVAIIRLHALYVNNEAPIEQQPIYGVDIALWSSLEINVAIICCSIPALKPLFTRIFPKLVNSMSNTSKRSREGRSGQGSLPLRSIDARTLDSSERTARKDIMVQQSFEMRVTEAGGDTDSEENLITTISPSRKG